MAMPEPPTLQGKRVRLEPLTLQHLPSLERVAFEESTWAHMASWVKTPAQLQDWAETALEWRVTRNAIPWVTVLQATGEAIGSTRFADLDLQHRTVEIGWTWLAAAYRGTGINTEAKLLQLAYAFDALQLCRVALKTHHENLRSRAAMLAMGAQYEGMFRNHMLMPDGSTRHTAWYSIIAEEWPRVRCRLEARLLAQTQPSA